MIWQGAAVGTNNCWEALELGSPTPCPPERAAALTSVSENFLINGEQTGLTQEAAGLLAWTKEAPATSPSRGGQQRLA